MPVAVLLCVFTHPTHQGKQSFMNTEVSSGRVRQNKNKSSGGIPLTAFMAGLVLLSSGASHAADSPAANAGAAGDGPASAASTADGSVAELQAEVARLKKALEKSQKELAEQQGGTYRSEPVKDAELITMNRPEMTPR